jgi:hypothetical protein
MPVKDYVTVVAASVAAAASLITLTVNLRAQLRTELRLAQRKFLEPVIIPLGEALHEMMASSHLMTKAKSDDSWGKWVERAEGAQAELKEMIPRLRYPLWGVDDGLRMLTRLPDWMQHARGDSARSAELLAAADALRLALDRAIQSSYDAGRRPTWLERRRVAARARTFQAVFNRTSPRRAAGSTAPSAAGASSPAA